MANAITITIAIVLASVIIWLLLGRRSFRIRISDLRGQIDEFLDMCEAGSGLSFSRTWGVWPVRLSIDGLIGGEARLTVTVYAADLGSEVDPDVRARADSSTNVLSQMRRSAINDIVCFVLGSLGLTEDGSTDRMFLRYTPMIYGPRADTRIRDLYRSISSDLHPRLFRRIHSFYERKTTGRRYQAIASFKVRVELTNTYAPRYPQTMRSTSTAA